MWRIQSQISRASPLKDLLGLIDCCFSMFDQRSRGVFQSYSITIRRPTIRAGVL